MLGSLLTPGHTERPRLRIWAEDLPAEVIIREDVLGPLARLGIGLVVSVRPWSEDGLPRVQAACREAGVPLSIWPMLDDAGGRWANVANADAFAAFAMPLLDRLAARDALPDELVIDLEPAIDQLRSVLARGTVRMGAPQAPTHRALAEVLAHAGRRGLGSWAAVVPMVVADAAGGGGWQRLLGTPVDALPLARVSLMLYSSLATGYARGWLRRADVRSLLHWTAQAARRRYGARACASLGAVGPGALGDEAILASPSELADDVGLVRAAGIDELALFDLRGMLARPPVCDWLDALASPPASTPPPATARALAIVGLAWAFGHLGHHAPVRLG